MTLLLLNLVMVQQGVYNPEKFRGERGPLPKALTIFMTKICDFSYPVYD